MTLDNPTLVRMALALRPLADIHDPFLRTLAYERAGITVESIVDFDAAALAR